MEYGTLQDYLGEIAKAVGQPSVSLKVWNQHTKGYRTIESLEECVEWVKSAQYPAYYQIHGSSKVGAFKRDDIISRFCIVAFPGCCAFAISTGVYVYGGYTQRGVNKIANRLRQAIANAAGYTALICTDVDNNKPERKTLAANGWQDIYQITNKRTNHVVNISVKEL